ncbi:MAG: NAD(P)-dependent oxidoreductase [Sphingobium sp.]
MTIRAGFIGLGSMGAPIARRLARRGFDVTGCDIAPEMLEAFDEPGTKRSADAVETARDSDMLGICVRTDAQLEAVLGDGRVFAALGGGGILFLHSTVAPELAVSLAERAAVHGVDFIDVGVSGGAPRALEGTLSLFVGAEDAALERARPWLDAIGATAHLGPVGRGQVGKLLNNLVSVANYGMAASILDVGDKLGFDREQLRQALMAGSAQGFALQAVVGLLRPRGGLGAPGTSESLHDLLKKDVDHAATLLPATDPAMAGLLASCDVMLKRILQSAEEGKG